MPPPHAQRAGVAAVREKLGTQRMLDLEAVLADADAPPDELGGAGRVLTKLSRPVLHHHEAMSLRTAAGWPSSAASSPPTASCSCWIWSRPTNRPNSLRILAVLEYAALDGAKRAAVLTIAGPGRDLTAAGQAESDLMMTRIE